jgi:N-6 DNA Methylase
MDERYGGWGRLLALFRLIHKGHKTHFVQARGGKLFDPDEFPFLEGRAAKDEPGRVLNITDGCLLRILEGLMTLRVRGGERERLSYRALDVEQIGSVYETVMGFTVEAAKSRVLAIKAGKNNKTPVFVALDELLVRKGKDRIKDLKENAGRGQVSAAQSKAIETATSSDELAAALDGIVDERGSPHHAVAPPGSPILQPTDERRRTGSHYTPRSLTAPIAKHALEPAFERLGEDATPDQVLDLKVCDPAMGSGAFLVEACRTIGERLVRAWEKHPDKKPTVPADEDEQLHARRLVAQRCLYGVDKNPRAVDLARLSLWLATLARDHEFTFLDHVLKCGDSLVGLTTAQIAAATWDESKPALPLFRQLVKGRVEEAMKARAEIQAAPDDTSRAIQEARHHALEGRLAPIRTMGDAVVAAFFAADKPRAREKKRAEVESWLSGSLDGQSEKLAGTASSLHQGEHPVPPFHWQIEFPEVFTRENGGFDAIVGNPPFLGGKRISSEFGNSYRDWLPTIHQNAHGNADLVAHFFRRCFDLLRMDGRLGLIATNTIGQGDTRSSGLAPILSQGGAIARAIRRLKWPGEAAVVVSVVHISKGEIVEPILDANPVRRISAYLVEGDLDRSPELLAASAGKAFQGSIVLGMGFIFDDGAAAKGTATSLDDMKKVIAKNPRNTERIFPYIGGEELNNDPEQKHSRYVIDFEDMTEVEARNSWPDLVAILERLVKQERKKQKREDLRNRWWQFAYRKNGLYASVKSLPRVLAISCQASPHMAFAFVPPQMVYAHSLDVVAFATYSSLVVLQSRLHELWTRFFSSTLEERLRYSPSDCFRTFPFPETFESDTILEAVGESYHAFRAKLMIERNEGLTKTYNRFHARGENASDIARLRILHAEMDAAILRAYGWDDLADQAAPEFIEQDADEGKTPKTRLDWPAEFKDEVLARLLALNAERAAAERAAGLTSVPEADVEDFDEEEVA